MESKSEYNRYSDKDLVDIFIFSYPADPIKLENELNRRGLFEWAQEMFNKLYEIFNNEWDKRISKD